MKDDTISRNAIIQKLNAMDRYVSEELRLCDTDKKFPKNEVFIVDDVYEEIAENLPSVQPEPCEDAISRKDAIRWVKTKCNPYGKPTLDFESGKKVIEYLKHMSPVTPKRKTGEWQIYVISPFDGEGCRCSECKYEGVPYWDFCPNCGADMRGRQDE